MSQFHKGQKVILSDRRGQVEATVERVGRKWVYITRYSREVAFDAQTGVENSQYGAPDRIYTLEGWADKCRREDVLKKLNECGIEWRFGGHERRYSTDILQQVLGILESAPSKT
ncbi:beta barrel domain-containing protein [Mycobacterium avium]|uniref:beta barrel domain-containing protein n=1 Tax=Mycobacterium avium TaxID=1764 RepID=UPI000B4B8DBE|nr:hypothetical protein [Mycobacterium avium]QBC87374.1 hypothetical protein B6K05_023390 [Mycobacterium avium subsp. hominissuis]